MTKPIQEFLVCSVCHGSLQFSAEIRCAGCGRAYAADGAPRMIPTDKLHGPRWETWRQLQDNALLLYVEEPSSSSSTPGREDIAEFAEWAGFQGLVCDIGCGILPEPYYVTLSSGAQFVGVDPIMYDVVRTFPFAVALAEYLPFAANTFDQICFGSSLDHCVEPARAIFEAGRVLKPDGTLIILQGYHSTRNPLEFPGRRILGRVKRSLLRTPKPRWLQLRESLTIPLGAHDVFHMADCAEDDIVGLCHTVRLELVARKEIPSQSEVFMAFKRER